MHVVNQSQLDLGRIHLILVDSYNCQLQTFGRCLLYFLWFLRGAELVFEDPFDGSSQFEGGVQQHQGGQHLKYVSPPALFSSKISKNLGHSFSKDCVEEHPSFDAPLLSEGVGKVEQLREI